ncbi:MAG TPA: hypothetical protein DEA26_03130 [Oceanospirillales bacterium]|nr:hypothetical protein [Oceanospirillaceae bacterium]HBS41647.1 hypothetical protein [Oceanospirillales bacterium]|tara:strand:- start:1833 stop:2210 length:378 start_codon:yes stop_codon:yes gene_type:complete
MSKTTPTVTPKASLAWWTMALSYLATLALLAAIPIVSPPTEDNLGANVTGILIGWVIMSLPLLLFIPGILKKSPYVASWLSYVSLMYFVLVMALSSGVWIWLLSASSVMMFLGSMMFTRWQKAGI